MRIFVTGATGFIGRRLIARLSAEGHEIFGLVRPGSEDKLGTLSAHVRLISGTIENVDKWKTELDRIDALINLIGIIREFPRRGITFEKSHVQVARNLVNLAIELGAKRFLQMSALGVSADSKAEYHHSKHQAEQIVKSSQLDWTIFRPSLVVGRESEAIRAIIELVQKLPLVPIVGNGQYRLQPIDIDDLVEGFAGALTNPIAVGKTYEMGGPEKLSYDQIVDRTASQLGKKAHCLHLSVGLARIAASLFESFSFFPLTNGMITMLLEESVTDSNSFFEDLGIKPISFEESLRKEILNPINRH